MNEKEISHANRKRKPLGMWMPSSDLSVVEWVFGPVSRGLKGMK